MKTKDKEEKLTPSLILKMFAETDKKFEKSRAKSEKEWEVLKFWKLMNYIAL